MSNSVRPQRWQPTRLSCPWDSPGKNTGVGCHFLLQCMKVKSESEVAQSCPTLSDPMDGSLPGSSVHGVLKARGPKPGCQQSHAPSESLGRILSCFLLASGGGHQCLMIFTYSCLTAISASVVIVFAPSSSVSSHGCPPSDFSDFSLSLSLFFSYCVMR